MIGQGRGRRLSPAGVESVLGFCTPEQHDRFLEQIPVMEKYIVEGGVQLIRIWLESSDKEQKRRFEARIPTIRSGRG
jgi:polyphosphate kinase 2 (PPK2 family)